MPKPEFIGPYAKLRRAEHFIRELEEDRVTRAEALRKTARTVIKNGRPYFAFDDKNGQSLHPGLITGDAVHNLRASLDLMSADLAQLNGQDRNQIKFPFSVSAAELDRQIKNKRFDLAGQDAVDLLRRQIAPYHGGNQALRNLHDLDIQDKHTALIVNGSKWAFSGNPTEPQSVTLNAFDYIFPHDSVFPGEHVLHTLKHLVEVVESTLEAFASLVAARSP